MRRKRGHPEASNAVELTARCADDDGALVSSFARNTATQNALPQIIVEVAHIQHVRLEVRPVHTLRQHHQLGARDVWDAGDALRENVKGAGVWVLDERCKEAGKGHWGRQRARVREATPAGAWGAGATRHENYTTRVTPATTDTYTCAINISR